MMDIDMAELSKADLEKIFAPRAAEIMKTDIVFKSDAQASDAIGTTEHSLPQSNDSEQFSVLKHPFFSKYIEKNISYYRLAFEKLDIDEYAGSRFNWAAGLLGPIWFGYRRMLPQAIGYSAAFCILFEIIGIMKGPIGSVTLIAAAVGCIWFFGSNANDAYFRKAKEDLMLSTNEDEVAVNFSPHYGYAFGFLFGQIFFSALIGIILSKIVYG